MQTERIAAAAPPPGGPRWPRGPARQLERALIALARGHGRVTEHRERNWASITFAGTRHRLRIAYAGAEAIDGGENLIACLPDHEFAIARYLVADAQVIGVTHTALPDPVLTVEAEILLLEE